MSFPTKVVAVAGLKYKKVVGNDLAETASLSYVDIPDMSITVTLGANPVLILAHVPLYAHEFGYMRLLIDDAEKAVISRAGWKLGDYDDMDGITWLEVVTAGEHTFKLQWRNEVGSNWILNQGDLYPRTLIVIELEGAEELS